MILKTTTEKKKVTRIETVKRQETFVEALTRIRKDVRKLLAIDGIDCTAICKKRVYSCRECPLGSPTAEDGKRCISTRVEDLITEAIERAKEAKV